MEFTEEKLIAGLTVAGFSPVRQQFVLANWKAILPLVKKYIEAFMPDWPNWPQVAQSPILTQIPAELSRKDFSLLFIVTYAFMTEMSKEVYLSKGYPEELWRDAMPDITWHLHDMPDGTLWIDNAPKYFNWQLSILLAANVTLGRLQFYPGESPCDFPEQGIKKDDNVVGFHIPANGPLDTDKCIASFKRAQEFFAKYKPNWSFKAFYCRSWFLNPIYKKYLPETSNIVKFQKLGASYDAPDSDSLDTIARVFTFNSVDFNDPKPPTALQKLIQKLIKEGEPVRAGTIIIPKFA